MSALLTYALNAENQLVQVDDVPNGNACNCICPHCKKPLMAKNGGEIREHHFSHQNNQECAGAYESALHLLAKEIIEKEGGIMLPDDTDTSLPSGFVKLRNIEIEKWDENLKIIPDAQGILPDGRKLYIEFLVSHKVLGKKYETITSNNLLCIEIDIKYEKLEWEALCSYLTKDKDGRKWIKKIEAKKPKDDISISHTRDSRYDKLAHFLKETFETNTLTIKFPIYLESYDLKKYGYDRCMLNEKYRNFKCDLLLYNSSKPGENFIAINIRGRHRNLGSRLPKDLRIIDIIVKKNETETDLFNRFKDGILKKNEEKNPFLGAWKK